MNSIAIPTLKEISMSDDKDISQQASELIRKIAIEPGVRKWINAVWKYLRNRHK